MMVEPSIRVSTVEMHRRRLLFLSALLFAFGILLMMRLVQWQIIEHPQLRALAQARHSKKTEIAPQRGEIRDRNGRVLAVSLRNDEVVGDPLFFQQQTPAVQQAILARVAPILGIPPEHLRQQLLAGSSHYTRIKSSVPLTVSKVLLNAYVSPAITIVPKVQRVYPSGALLAHILGFLNAEGNGIGIEGSYDEHLRGIPGQKLFEEKYGWGLPKVPVITPPQHGADITLTIDINIQYMVERELEKVLEAERTMTGTIVVMDPKTGEIIAMAGRPTFDPNAYSDVPPAVYSNPAITDPWEPGSIVKILTIAAALDTGRITPKSTFNDRGCMKYRGIEICNRDKKAYGTITPAQILQYSSNVGIVQVADVLSTTAFYTYMHGAFGIGVKTGIDLPFESAGSLRMPGTLLWNRIDLATHSYGQGFAATPIQMTTAVAAIANRGVMMRPYTVIGVHGQSDNPSGPSPLRRVIRSETASLVTEMLVSVVETTVKEARVPGYRLGGKTGTALIPPPAGRYDENETIASFIGYGPAEDPRFVILVRVDRPQVHKTGGEVAAPVFRNIAQWLLAYFRIPPADLRAQR